MGCADDATIRPTGSPACDVGPVEERMWPSTTKEVAGVDRCVQQQVGKRRAGPATRTLRMRSRGVRRRHWLWPTRQARHRSAPLGDQGSAEPDWVAAGWTGFDKGETGRRNSGFLALVVGQPQDTSPPLMAVSIRAFRSSRSVSSASCSTIGWGLSVTPRMSTVKVLSFGGV